MAEKQHLTSIGSLFDQTLTFFKAKWRVFAPIMLVASTPSIILSFIGITQGERFDNNTIRMLTSYPTAPILIGFVGLLVIANIILSVWGQTAAFYTLKKLVDGTPSVEWDEAYKGAKPLIFGLVVTELITGLIVVGGLLLLIIPGIIFGIWGFAVAYVYIFEGTPYYGAFKRSRALVKDYELQVLGRLVAIGLALGLFNVIASLIPILGPVIVVLVSTPFGLYYGYLIYKDLRRIKG